MRKGDAEGLAPVSGSSTPYPYSQNHSLCVTLRYDLPMPPARSTDLPASMAILGLLIRNGDTGAGVGIRLTETFPRARWPRATVHKTMPGLVDKELVKLVSEGVEPGANYYEATERRNPFPRLGAWFGRTVSPASDA